MVMSQTLVLLTIATILSIQVTFSSGITSNYYWGHFKNFVTEAVSITLITTELQPVPYIIEAPGVTYYHNGTFTTDDVITINLPEDVIVSSHTEQHKGIHASIQCERVTLIGQTIAVSGSSDTFLVLPTTTTAATATTATTNNNNEVEHVYYGISVARNSNRENIVLVVGIKNNTKIKLTVTQSVTISVGIITTKLSPGREYSFIINRLQTLFIESIDDLSGTKIVTNNEVSVLSGHEAALVPSNFEAADHLIEQIPSTEFWGNKYYTAPFVTTSYTIKVLAAYNSTNVTIYCNDTVEHFAINEGEFINKTLMFQEYCTISSNKKVLVVQFSHGRINSSNSDSTGDPMMTLVPAISQYLNQLDFSTIISENYSHYINIIVMAQYYQPSMIYLRSGGVNMSLESQEWVPIVVNNITEAYAARVEVSEGLVQIVHSDSNALITAISYGFGRFRAYGHPGGLNLIKTVAVSLSQSQYSVVESNNSLTGTITLSSRASEDVIVEVTISDGSANAGVDYAMSTALVFNVTISAGSTSSSFSIDIINDMIQEDNETFNIAIRLLSSFLLLSLGTSSSTVTIIDDEVVMIDFTSSLFTGLESDRVVSVQVEISGGITSSSDIYVDITLVSITANGNNIDFDSTTLNVTIVAGTNISTVNITLQSDDIVEGDEMFNITLSVPSSLNSRITTGTITSATGIIVDTTAIKIDLLICDNTEEWQVSEGTSCSSYEYENLTSHMTQVCDSNTLSELTNTMEQLTNESVLLTNARKDGTSACTTDLVNIVLVLEFIVNITEIYPEVLSSQDIIQRTTDVFSNILSPLNNPGWRELQMTDPLQSQRVLMLSERFGIILAENLDAIVSSNFVNSENIMITIELVNASSTDEISFSEQNSILIPAEFINQRSNMTGINPIPIATIHYENIQNILPVISNGTLIIQPISQILSSQVTNVSLTDTSTDVDIQLTLQYLMENLSVNSMPRCGYWNFSLHKGRGGWDTRGVTTVTNDINNSVIICNSSHLTSFAVLVDVSGSHQGFSAEERQALSIVSYIGCGISLVCLMIAIIIFVYYRNTIFKEVQNFVHLNLSIALSLALVVFVSGIETATANDIACKVVAALLHYFFTAVFSWMLCEGILLYFLLVKVFNIGLGQKKWLYLSLGWGIPVPIVAISVGIAHDQYGNEDFCWIATDEGAIWGFVAPMMAIIIVNVTVLVMVVYSLYKSEKNQMTAEEATRAQIVKMLLKISVILLPLLGITWVFGILAVNQESSVFAWIFTILNSLQGMFILAFQVLRNEKLRQKFTNWWKKEKFNISSSKGNSSIQRNKTSATNLSGFNTIDPIMSEASNDNVFKDASAVENEPKSKSLEMECSLKNQHLSSKSSEINTEGSVTSIQAFMATDSVA